MGELSWVWIERVGMIERGFILFFSPCGHILSRRLLVTKGTLFISLPLKERRSLSFSFQEAFLANQIDLSLILAKEEPPSSITKVF